MIPPELFVIMPFYNASSTLQRAVSSLRCISPGNRQRVKLIGIDDGSTDDSSDIFMREADKITGLPWELLSKPNGGSGSARNMALRSFTKGWTLCLDADDEITTDPFQFLDTPPNVNAVIFDAVYYRNEKKFLRIRAHQPDPTRLPEIFSSRSPYHPLSIVFRRERLKHLFDENLKYLEDWHFLAINPQLFSSCAVHPGISIGIVHGGENNKSADQYNNGLYRVKAADSLASFWGDSTQRIVSNNLKIQHAIGRIQMGQKRDWSAFLRIPASPTLYAKLFIYTLLYKLYLAMYPYR